jgi:hypothetical protein
MRPISADARAWFIREAGALHELIRRHIGGGASSDEGGLLELVWEFQRIGKPNDCFWVFDRGNQHPYFYFGIALDVAFHVPKLYLFYHVARPSWPSFVNDRIASFIWAGLRKRYPKELAYAR